MTNTELWNGVKEGNTKSFEILHNYYRKQMINYGKKIGFEKDTIEDIIQNIFIKLFINRANLPQQVNIRSYLFRILINALLDHQKRKHQKFIPLKDILHLPIHDVHSDNTFNSNGEYDNEIHLFKCHLKKLNKKQREAIHLRFTIDASWEEMSAILKISPHSCMNLINKSIAKLKKMIKEEQSSFLIFMLAFAVRKPTEYYMVEFI